MANGICPRCKTRPITKNTVGYCRECALDWQKARRSRRKALFLSGELQHPESKQCKKCLLIKEASQFPRNYPMRDGLSNWCQSCTNEWHLSRSRTREARFRSGELQHPESKQCSACHAIKPASDFTIVYAKRGGLSDRCKDCSSAAATKSNKRRKYGMDDSAIIAMLASQGNACPICLKPIVFGERKNNCHIDHDHQTGQVRGILCEMCNPGLGKFDDDPARLAMAIDYVKRTLPLNCPSPGSDQQAT